MTEGELGAHQQPHDCTRDGAHSSPPSPLPCNLVSPSPSPHIREMQLVAWGAGGGGAVEEERVSNVGSDSHYLATLAVQ